MLIRDVYKRTRRQSRASSQGPASNTSPTGVRSVPGGSGPAADPARLARFLQQQQTAHYSVPVQRVSSNPRHSAASDGEYPSPPSAREYRAPRYTTRRVDTSSGSVDGLIWPSELRALSSAVAAREEDKEEETVVDTRDVGLGTVVL